MKICDECGGNHYAKGKCRLHYKMPSQINPNPIKKGQPIGDYIMTSNKASQSIKKPKPINKVSDKEKKRQVAYSALKKEYMKQYPECQVRLEGCTHKAIDIHHLYFGADRYGHFLDSSSWKSTCRSCHNRIHDELSGEQLIELGLRLKD